MNTPNKLTILRIALAPVFLLLLLLEDLPNNYFWSGVVFAFAAITDIIDGQLARRNNQVTTFGKFLDPLADKMLVTAALLGLLHLRLTNPWIPMIILTREFIVTSVRLVAAGEGKVIPANIWGKIKTVVQMLTIIVVLLLKQGSMSGMLPLTFPLEMVSEALLTICAVLTAISGIQYVWSYRAYINTKK